MSEVDNYVSTINRGRIVFKDGLNEMLTLGYYGMTLQSKYFDLSHRKLHGASLYPILIGKLDVLAAKAGVPLQSHGTIAELQMWELCLTSIAINTLEELPRDGFCGVNAAKSEGFTDIFKNPIINE